MAGNRDHSKDGLIQDGLAPDQSLGLLAEEDELDRRVLWRLASWGVCAVGAVTLAVYTNQSSLDFRRSQLTAAADLVRQSQQIQSVARDSQSESRRLASAISTLNADRDRLYTRVTELEQGLNSVTGSIGRQAAAATPPASDAPPKSPPPAAPVASLPATSLPAPSLPAPNLSAAEAATVKSETQSAATPLMAARSFMAPPDVAASKLSEPEPSAPPQPAAAIPEQSTSEANAAPAVSIQRTEFGVDIGSAPSLQGLRALWRRQIKAHASLEGLRPIMVVRELAGAPGVQFRLVAGPLGDAAAAARLCASLPDANRACEPAVYDGQRLALTSDLPPQVAKPLPRKPRPKVIKPEEPAPKPQAALSPSPQGGR